MATNKLPIEYRQCPCCKDGIMTHAGVVHCGTLPDGKPKWIVQWKCARRTGCGHRTVNPGLPCDYDGNPVP